MTEHISCDVCLQSDNTGFMSVYKKFIKVFFTKYMEINYYSNNCYKYLKEWG